MSQIIHCQLNASEREWGLWLEMLQTIARTRRLASKYCQLLSAQTFERPDMRASVLQEGMFSRLLACGGRRNQPQVMT